MCAGALLNGLNQGRTYFGLCVTTEARNLAPCKAGKYGGTGGTEVRWCGGTDGTEVRKYGGKMGGYLGEGECCGHGPRPSGSREPASALGPCSWHGPAMMVLLLGDVAAQGRVLGAGS